MESVLQKTSLVSTDQNYLNGSVDSAQFGIDAGLMPGDASEPRLLRLQRHQWSGSLS